MALVLVVVALVGLRETLPLERRRPATVRASLASYRALLRDRVFVALAFVGGSMLAAMFAYVVGRARSCCRTASGWTRARSAWSSVSTPPG